MSGNQEPQGQQNALSAFGFKPNDASNTTSSNLGSGFASSGGTPSLFGGVTGAQNTTTNNTGTATPPKASVFGSGGFGSTQNLNQGGQQASAAGGNIFGSSSQTGSLFGGAPSFGTTTGSAATSFATANPLFGGGTTQSTTPSTTSNTTFGGASSTPSASLSGIFGSTSNNQPTQAGTTPAAGGLNNPTPGTNFFKNDSSKTSLFGGTSNATNPQPTLSIFGASNNNQLSSTQNMGTTGSSASSATPSAPSIFGNTPATASISTPSMFGGFGPKPTDASTQPGASASVALFGGNNTTNKPPTPAPSGNVASSTTTPSTTLPSLFSNLPKKPETPPVANATPAAPSTFSGFSLPAASKDATDGGEKAANTGGISLGAAAATSDGSKDSSKDTAPNKENAPAASPFVGFNLGSSTIATSSKAPATSGDAGTTAATAATTSAALTVPSVPAPSLLRGKTIEDIVNRWTTELETHTREFSQFAGEVAVWDRTLIENGNYISALYATVLAAESTQASLDQALDHIEQQQRHLTATLDQYEKSASEILHGPGGIMTSTEGLGLADSERDKSYAMAANLYTQLDDLSRSLTQMVESVNALNLSPGPSHGPEDGSQEDAISTIAGILNAHLSSLQWIDGALNDMEGRLKDAERKINDPGARGIVRTDGGGKSRSYGLGSSWR